MFSCVVLDEQLAVFYYKNAKVTQIILSLSSVIWFHARDISAPLFADCLLGFLRIFVP